MAVHTAGNTHIGTQHLCPGITDDAPDYLKNIDWSTESMCNAFILGVKHTVEGGVPGKELSVWYYVYRSNTQPGGPVQTAAVPCVFACSGDGTVGERLSTDERPADISPDGAGGERWVEMKVKLKRRLVEGETVVAGVFSDILAPRWDESEHVFIFFKSLTPYSAGLPSADDLCDSPGVLGNMNFSLYIAYDDAPPGKVLAAETGETSHCRTAAADSSDARRTCTALMRLWDVMAGRIPDTRNEMCLFSPVTAVLELEGGL